MTVAIAGCGHSGPELAPVGGRLTLDGQPIHGIQLRFQPEGTGSPSYGSSDRDGKYELGYKRGQQGALIGWHAVIFEMDQALDSNGKPIKRSQLHLPSAADLRCEVKPESNVFDFDLKSEKK